MARRWALAAAVAAAVLAAGGATAAFAAPAVPANLAPGCHHKTVYLNSGNGPVWHLVVCDGDDPVWIVDGGPLVNHAVIFGFPRGQ